jgi:hypothetical protein
MQREAPVDRNVSQGLYLIFVKEQHSSPLSKYPFNFKRFKFSKNIHSFQRKNFKKKFQDFEKIKIKKRRKEEKKEGRGRREKEVDERQR